MHSKRNKEIYFEPQETVGLGTTAVGIGSVLQFDSFGLNTVGLGTTFGSSSLAVPIKSLYFKDHNLQTGDNLHILQMVDKVLSTMTMEKLV